MDPSDIAFLKAVVLGLFTAGTGLTAWWLHLRHRARRAPDLERELEELRVEQARERTAFETRLAELEERVDFAERRLVQERADPKRLEPRVPTPV